MLPLLHEAVLPSATVDVFCVCVLSVIVIVLSVWMCSEQTLCICLECGDLKPYTSEIIAPAVVRKHTALD